jgi:hypothetical protein
MLYTEKFIWIQAFPKYGSGSVIQAGIKGNFLRNSFSQLPCYDLRRKTPDSKPFKEIFFSNGLGTVVFTRTVILKGLGHEIEGRRVAK